MKMDFRIIRNRAISLISLVILIIVIIILAGAVILTLVQNNPIDAARKAKFVNDIDTFKSQLELYKLDQLSVTLGAYNPKLLNADKDSSTENGNPATNDKTMVDIIESMKNTNYPDILEIIAGELVYVGSDSKESNWCDGIIETKDFKINISVIPNTTSFYGTITLTGLMIDESKIDYYRVYISDKAQDYPEEIAQEITDKSSQVTFALIENISPNTKYYIQVRLKMSNEPEERIKEIEVISSPDNVGPNMPQISVGMYSKSLTIAPIAITLTDNEGGSGINKTESKYILDKTSDNYDKDNTIWTTAGVSFRVEDFISDIATLEVIVPEEGEYYIHVLSVDNALNKTTGVSSKAIVDTTEPQANIDLPTTTTVPSINAHVILTDNESGSGLNILQCKYIYSTNENEYGIDSNEWNTAQVFTQDNQTLTVVSSTNDTYYLHVLVVDMAGNRKEILSSGVTTNTDTPVAPTIVGTVSTNTWTNQNVVLTVSQVASPNISRYEYSVNSGSWQTYNATNRIAISNEGITTVKARAVNNVGTIGAESIGYIVRIDKTAPQNITINVSSSSNRLNVTMTLSDSSSGINLSMSRYIVTTQSTVYETDNTIWNTAIVLGVNPQSISVALSDGDYYVHVLSTDNAGNLRTSVSSKVTVQNIPPAIDEGQAGTPYPINSTINGGPANYNNPIIPKGFFPINTPDASWIVSGGVPQGWNNGLVIQDQFGNQYTWVPVDGVSVIYTKLSEVIGNPDYEDYAMPQNVSEIDQINRYKGFYVARFEASLVNGKIASKRGQMPADLDIYNSAKATVEAVSASYGYEGVITSLITGTEWDTLVIWIQNSGKNITNSSSWGNYDSDSQLYATGSVETWKAKNIYDLAGNIGEWTNEIYHGPNGNYKCYRGPIGNGGISQRGRNKGTSTSNVIGARVALYIM